MKTHFWTTSASTFLAPPARDKAPHSERQKLNKGEEVEERNRFRILVCPVLPSCCSLQWRSIGHPGWFGSEAPNHTPCPSLHLILQWNIPVAAIFSCALLWSIEVKAFNLLLFCTVGGEIWGEVKKKQEGGVFSCFLFKCFHLLHLPFTFSWTTKNKTSKAKEESQNHSLCVQSVWRTAIAETSDNQCLNHLA